MISPFQEILINKLKSDPRLTDPDGELMINKVHDLVDGLDEGLLELLLSEVQLRDKFFKKVKDALVFKNNDFKFYLDEHKLDNSYTEYENRIGLTVARRFLKDSNDVVVDFPFKDCILEGGQSTEDGIDTSFEFEESDGHYIEKHSKRKEIFFNQILAKDEIDRLLENKALTNVHRFDTSGKKQINTFSRNERNIVNDNLIIKGNNLLVLHSLKSTFTNKIKVIYIDPPYNTGSDSFKYNDNFSQSTWLTFMRNRLMVAKELLTDDGVIMVQCSFHQFAYLKVLMKDKSLFKKHLCDFNIQVRHPDRALTGDKEFNDIIEYVLIFSNNIEQKMPFIEVTKKPSEYIYSIKIKEGSVPRIVQCGKKTVEVFTPAMYDVLKQEGGNSDYKKISIRGSIREKNSSGRFFVKYLEQLPGYEPETLFRVPDMGDDQESFRYFYSAPAGNKNGGYYQGMPTSSTVTKKAYANFYNFEKEYNTVSNQGGVEFRNGKKPEELIKFLINIFSNEGDVVLDYHLGSGTTGAVAMKMNRKFIGIEQIDTQIDLSLERLQTVINGDETGISLDEDVMWQGGGSFVYMELAKNNANAIEIIKGLPTYESLVDFFEEMCEKYFLNYHVKVNEFKEVIVKEDHFKKISLEKQKEIFIKMLDLNQLYVNVADMKDSRYKLTKDDIQATNDFYLKG